jgi:hypothetical protein
VHSYDKVWEALVILYGVSTPYTQSRNINTKIESMMGGNLEALLGELTLDDQQLCHIKAMKDPKKRINWTWLPDVRKVLEPGSYVGMAINNVLNKNK